VVVPRGELGLPWDAGRGTSGGRRLLRLERVRGQEYLVLRHRVVRGVVELVVELVVRLVVRLVVSILWLRCCEACGCPRFQTK